MTPFISVIVPVYKVELYLRRCVDSILAQSLSNIELILIDDGSPDNSGTICDDYAQSDKRVKVIHKANGGVSSARNAGIEVAKGEWICFVDSDDYLDIDYLLNFHIHQDSPSVLYLQGYKVFDAILNKEEIHVFRTDEFDTVLDVLAEAEEKHIINSPCFKLFLRRIIEENNIRFDPTVSYGEDHLFSLNYFVHVNNCSKSIATGYINMRNGNESLTKRSVPLKEMLYYITEMRRLHEIIISKNECSNNWIEPAINTRFAKNIKKAFFDILTRKDKKTELIKLKEYLKRDPFKIMKGIALKDKVFVLMLTYAPTFLILYILKKW